MYECVCARAIFVQKLLQFSEIEATVDLRKRGMSMSMWAGA